MHHVDGCVGAWVRCGDARNRLCPGPRLHLEPQLSLSLRGSTPCKLRRPAFSALMMREGAFTQSGERQQRLRSARQLVACLFSPLPLLLCSSVDTGGVRPVSCLHGRFTTTRYIGTFTPEEIHTVHTVHTQANIQICTWRSTCLAASASASRRPSTRRAQHTAPPPPTGQRQRLPASPTPTPPARPHQHRRHRSLAHPHAALETPVHPAEASTNPPAAAVTKHPPPSPLHPPTHPSALPEAYHKQPSASRHPLPVQFEPPVAAHQNVRPAAPAAAARASKAGSLPRPRRPRSVGVAAAIPPLPCFQKTAPFILIFRGPTASPTRPGPGACQGCVARVERGGDGSERASERKGGLCVTVSHCQSARGAGAQERFVSLSEPE